MCVCVLIFVNHQGNQRPAFYIDVDYRIRI